MSDQFIINDESVVNSYGFKVLTKGISLRRFKANPVCLSDHRNTTKNVLGKWQNLKTDTGKLLGVPAFDTEDPDGKEVVRKVNSGTIKGCSMGIIFNEKNLIVVDDIVVLKACELLEVSIVPVRSNANAISLYNADGELISEDKIKELCLSVQSKISTKTSKMKTVITHLNLPENSDEAAVLSAVKELGVQLNAVTADRDAYKQKFEGLQAENVQKQKEAFEEKADLAVKEGRLDATGKTTLLELADGKYEKAMQLIDGLPKREKLNVKDKETELSAFDKMTWDELDRGGHLASLKADHKDYYVERYKKQFGVEPQKV